MRVAIRVKPGASRTKVGGSYGAGAALIVAVSERAVDGKATEAALKALADAIGVARRKVRLVSGVNSRDKLVEILDPPSGLAHRLETLRAG
ncbi:DUF167 domain-containing protein [Actinocrinis puniceicyclus]|nr:DUF167 domain-containing protein [Actinocrinis puniceicyclus]